MIVLLYSEYIGLSLDVKWWLVNEFVCWYMYINIEWMVVYLQYELKYKLILVTISLIFVLRNYYHDVIGCCSNGTRVYRCFAHNWITLVNVIEILLEFIVRCTTVVSIEITYTVMYWPIRMRIILIENILRTVKSWNIGFELLSMLGDYLEYKECW